MGRDVDELGAPSKRLHNPRCVVLSRDELERKRVLARQGRPPRKSWVPPPPSLSSYDLGSDAAPASEATQRSTASTLPVPIARGENGILRDTLLSLVILVAPPLAILPLWSSPHVRETKLAVTAVAVVWMSLLTITFITMFS